MSITADRPTDLGSDAPDSDLAKPGATTPRDAVTAADGDTALAAAEVQNLEAKATAAPGYPIYEGGTRLDVDPRHLVIGANVRTKVNPDKTFITSITTFGVLNAIRVYQDEGGHLLVEDGQVRTTVAVTVGRPTVPIEIIAPPSDADRIYQQLTQNDDRHPVTTTDRARAYLQLTLAGEKVTTIARTTGHKAALVKKLVAVGESDVAAQAADAYDLDLVQAAVVAEFAHDSEAVQQLIAAATGRGWQSFDHVAQQLRDARQSAKARAVVLAQCETDGLPVVDDAGRGCTAQELSRIGLGTIDAEDHRRSCPGHAVVLRDKWATAGREWYPVAVCVDPAANGHDVGAGSTEGTPKKLADMTPEQAEKARAERKEVRDNNLAWQSATAVRREWLGTFADRSRVPAGAEEFILRELLAAPWYLLDSLRDGREILGQAMLNRKDSDRATTTDDLVAAIVGKVGGNPKRSVVTLAALILSAWENNHGANDRGKSTWRTFSADDTRILRQMETWGYPLADVERLVAYPKPAPVKKRTRKPAQVAAAPSGEEPADGTPLEEVPDADDPAPVAHAERVDNGDPPARATAPDGPAPDGPDGPAADAADEPPGAAFSV